MRVTLFTFLLLNLSIAYLIHAQAPQTMSYQGILTDASGAAVEDGTYSITFKLYNVAAGGTPLWEEAQAVSVASGLFNVILGSSSSLNLQFDQPYWLAININSGTELPPRM